MINNISNSNPKCSTPSFQAKMRNKDLRAIKKIYIKELKKTTDPERMDFVIKGSQNFSKFLNKIGEGDKNFTLKLSKDYIPEILFLRHNNDKNFSTFIPCKCNIFVDKITHYNNLFSEKAANDVLEMEKTLSNNYEKKQQSTNFLSNLLKKI